MTGEAINDVDRRKRADRVSGLILALLVLAALALVLRQVLGIATGPPPPRTGARALAFSAVDPQDKPIALADLKDRVVLVDFWATWCPPCVASMPALEKLHRELGPRGFAVLGVNQEKGEEKLVQDFLHDHRISFPIAMDDGKIAHEWGVYTYPTSFLIGKDGVVKKMYRGVSHEATLRRDIEDALK